MASSRVPCLCALWARTPEMGGDVAGHHPRCFQVYFTKERFDALTAENARLAGQVAALREALAGMLESYEFCLGDELALSDLTKAVMRGAFVGDAARARAALATGGRGGPGVSGQNATALALGCSALAIWGYTAGTNLDSTPLRLAVDHWGTLVVVLLMLFAAVAIAEWQG